MKNLVKKLATLVFAMMMLMSMTLPAMAEETDSVSGAVMDDSIENVYKDRFEEACNQYADQLSDSEKVFMNKVYDAIGMMHFDSEDSLASRQRIYNIASADDLHAILTGYYDANDADYSSDAALDAKLQEIFTACGLNMDDYYVSVIRNVGGIPAPVTSTNWYCTFTLKTEAAAIAGDDTAEEASEETAEEGDEEEEEEENHTITIILYDEDMKVGSFTMNASLQ
jgi:hypothetical protein